MRFGIINSIYQTAQWEYHCLWQRRYLFFQDICSRHRMVECPFCDRWAISISNPLGTYEPLGSIKTQAIHSFIFLEGGYNTGGRCFSPSPAAAVNSPIAESEHHNFRCRALRLKRYFFRVFPLFAVARATKDAIIAKPCMRSDRSFSRVFREQTTMRGVVVDIVASGAQFLRQRERLARSYFPDWMRRV